MPNNGFRIFYGVDICMMYNKSCSKGGMYMETAAKKSTENRYTNDSDALINALMYLYSVRTREYPSELKKKYSELVSRSEERCTTLEL